ncbi:Ribonuclease T2 family protein [Euphorbia peplus]|nr:Ribonuclease T2 family protein [Euphorbia peplus]
MAIFLVLLVCFLCSVQSFGEILYATQWAPSYCSSSDKIRCKPPIKTNNFTIHGIWPPNSKCPGPPFMIGKVGKIGNDLDLYWPDLTKTSHSNIELWEHEWEEHGTCTGWTIDNYFGIGVARAKEFNVLAALQRNGIVVGGGEYDLALIKSSFPGNNVRVTCNQHKTTKKFQLQELKFCLNSTGSFESCSVKTGPIPSCSIKNNITLVEQKVTLPDASVV